MNTSGAKPDELESIYRERFRAFLLSMTALLGDGDAALEVVQDGFARALRSRGSFRREGNLEAWLWRIVVNVARDRLRARNRVSQPIDSIAEDPVVGADDDLKASLLALPERQRLAVFLRYYADLSYEQIAETLGVSPGTVAASLNAARTALRQRLQEVAR